MGLPARLEAIVADFELCEGREKLELLLDYARSFPAFPEHLQKPGQLEEVPECMTPVQMASEVKDGGINYFFVVPEESPTVRGYAAMMMEGVNGSTPEQVLAIPVDFYLRTGLQHVLTPQRLNGMAAILAHVKRRAAAEL
ncbi:SufE family protein [bacterium]|nr:SufE family protein [bacterium]